mmetsp:Transcript_6971/g.21213  ORF Transcript_6971/g.21213 Transcript_6971/m.21213 type:complete len:256 (+) Transcript_6971:120-887(+)
MSLKYLRGLQARLQGVNQRAAGDLSSHPLKELLARNRNWSKKVTDKDSDFFKSQEKQQQPKYLWIGCSDSRVPPNQVIDQPPGAIFVHRNIANVVTHSDLSCLSVLEFAVKMLKVEHVIVCGHYNCGGVAAALENNQLGLIDNWLRHIRGVHEKHYSTLNSEERPLTKEQKFNILCELNVIESVKNVCHTSIVQSAWASNQKLAVHGWIYGLSNGIIQDLGVTTSSLKDITEVYRTSDDSSVDEVSAQGKSAKGA